MHFWFRCYRTPHLYAGDWACFQAYCAAGGARALPASPELVAAFLAVPGTGRAALARRLAAIDHQDRQRGYAPPGLDAALRSARRAASRETRAAAPTPAALTHMAGACHGDLAGQRDRALLLTVKPMVNAGRFDVKVLSDGWTAVTRDRSLSAQFEHSIGVTESGCESFTLSPAGFTKPPYTRA